MFKRAAEQGGELVVVGGALSCVGGYVDAVGYLTLGHIYAANMSGNTVSTAIQFSLGNGWEMWKHACPIAAFFPGLVAGDLMVRAARGMGARSILAPAFLAEATGLSLALVWMRALAPGAAGEGAFNFRLYALLVGLLAFAMGMQNGALRRSGGLQDVHTYVTGTLLAMADRCAELLSWMWRRRRRGLRRVVRLAAHHRASRNGLYAALLWFCYLLGAVVAAWGVLRAGAIVLLGAVVTLLGMAVVDGIRPLALPARKSLG